MSSTRVSRHLNAPRERVYRALIDANAVAAWKVPTGMTSYVHEFDPREGGSFRVSLTYDEPTGTGKTTAHTDTYHGRFAKFVPNEQVVEVVESEMAEPALRGEMTITITLADADGGTELSPCTTDSRLAYRRPTTRPAGEKHSRSSPPLSKQPKAEGHERSLEALEVEEQAERMRPEQQLQAEDLAQRTELRTALRRLKEKYRRLRREADQSLVLASGLADARRRRKKHVIHHTWQ